MGGFLLGVGGLVLIIFLFIKEKISDGFTKLDMKYNKNHVDYMEEKYRMLMVDSSAYEQFKKICFDDRKRKEMVNAIADDLQYVYGDSWEAYFREPSIVDPGWTMHPCAVAYHITLSKLGKVPAWGTSNYFKHAVEPTVDRIIRMCQVIERNIQKFHPEMKMAFEPKIVGQKFSGKPIYGNLWDGVLTWEFVHAIIPMYPPLQRLW